MRYLHLCLTACLILTTGCTRRELQEESHAHIEDGYLKIKLIWSCATKPRHTQYYFYNKDGGAPLYRKGDTNGFEGYLPAGTYNVVICNTVFEGVNLNTALGYKADYVRAITLNEEGVISQVNHIYGTGIHEVRVIPAEVVEKTAKPFSLVKKITLLFQAATPKKIKGMSVNICGAVLQKRIVDHAMGDETAVVKSDATYNEQTGWFYCPISTLGFRSNCLLHLDVIYNDDEITDAYPIDLSEELNDFPEEEKTLEYMIQLTDGEEVKMTVQIHPWISGGGTGIIIQ